MAADLLRSARPAAIQRSLGLAPRAAPLCRLSAAHFTEYSLTSDDKLDIMEVCYKFDMALNMGQQERLGSFFVKEAEVVTPLAQVKGLQAILDYFDRCRPMAKGNRHLTSNIMVEPDGVNAAKVTAYRILHAASNPPALLASGIIEDRLVNVGGEWRFVQRKFLMDPPAAGPRAAAAAGPAQQQQQQQPAAGTR